MFNAQLFSNMLKNIVFYYDSIRDFSKASGFNRTSLSEYIRCKVKNPPSPEVLKKIADNSNGTVSYIELMQICGYLTEEDIIEINSNKVEYDDKYCIDLEISNFEELKEQLNELITLGERAKEIINSLSKK